MSAKVVIYTVKFVYGIPMLDMGLSLKVKEVVYKSHFVIDLPGLPNKLCAWWPYINNSYIFDNGQIVFFAAIYKRVDKRFALDYLLKYINSDRPNCKDYTLKKPKRINYKEFINQNKIQS